MAATEEVLDLDKRQYRSRSECDAGKKRVCVKAAQVKRRLLDGTEMLLVWYDRPT